MAVSLAQRLLRSLPPLLQCRPFPRRSGPIRALPKPSLGFRLLTPCLLEPGKHLLPGLSGQCF
eukprot:12003801-Alexandrium_andersonii.AAC.1